MFEGPWKVADKKELASGLPTKGEIIKHSSGAIVLRCPVCNAMQFAHSPVSGPDDAPTLSKAIQCGAGTCKRCGVWFAVDAGKTIIKDNPKVEPTPLPTKLRKAGVKPPPKITVDRQ